MGVLSKRENLGIKCACQRVAENTSGVYGLAQL